MNMLFKLTIVICACCSVAACNQTTGVTNPCDVLVAINPLPETNAYLVAHDRGAAVGLARHRGRYAHYCGRAD